MAETYSLAEATMKVIQDRRSIREWTEEPVSEEDIGDDSGGRPSGAVGRERAALAIYRGQGSGRRARNWRVLRAMAAGAVSRRSS